MKKANKKREFHNLIDETVLEAQSPKVLSELISEFIQRCEDVKIAMIKSHLDIEDEEGKVVPYD